MGIAEMVYGSMCTEGCGERPFAFEVSTTSDGNATWHVHRHHLVRGLSGHNRDFWGELKALVEDALV